MRPGAETRATALGAGAVLLWSALALLTVGAKRVPPFQLLALTFAVAALLGVILAVIRRQRLMRVVKDHPRAVALATTALFGYHFFYFVALRNAPAVDASLIAYLWPLLIVVLAGIVQGALRMVHLVGAILGLAGAWLVIAARGGMTLDSAYAAGYGAAAACALIWSAYSVLNRRHAGAPVDVVAVACLLTAAAAAVVHFALEKSASLSAREWLFVALLGLGPVGAAFFLWDHGTKRGNLPLLGVASYAAPVISTALLVVAGEATASWQLAAAAALVAGGAALASRRA
ncbi:MAG TPA: EamA family transporter [Burkholderiales bacterium]|nr:EamA family transporter [Burkholderiales bacterium]